MYTYLQQALPRVVATVRFSPMKENRVHQTRISTKTDKDGFSLAVFRSRLEQKIPVTECYSDAFLFCFLMRNLWVAVFVSVAITFHSFALCAAKVPLSQCSRVSLL